MEKQLKFELSLLFPKITIYPLSAPDDYVPPYIIYHRDSTFWEKTLDGYTKNESINYIINIFSKNYDDMLEMREITESFLKEMESSTIGKDNDIYIEEVVLNAVGEIFENELSLYRGVVDFVCHIQRE